MISFVAFPFFFSSAFQYPNTVLRNLFFKPHTCLPLVLTRLGCLQLQHKIVSCFWWRKTTLIILSFYDQRKQRYRTPVRHLITGPHENVNAASRDVDSYATAKLPENKNQLSYPSQIPWIPRDSRSMATAAQAVLRVLQSQKSAAPAREPAVVPAQKLRASDSSPDNLKIVLQPRLCTLRSYGPDRSGVIKTRRDGDDVSPFFATLSEYIESSKKSQDFEIISGRLAMVSFWASPLFRGFYKRA